MAEYSLDDVAEKIHQGIIDGDTELRIRVSLLPDTALITTEEVCSLARITEKTWIQHLKKYPNPPVRLGSRGSYMYRKSAVIRFLRAIGKISLSKNHANKSIMGIFEK